MYIATAASARSSGDNGVVEAERQLGPLEYLLAVGLRNADEVGDHVQREPQRDIRHEIALACVRLRERTKDAVDPIADLLLELRDAAGREAGADQLPQLGVQRRILADQQLAHLPTVLGHTRLEERMRSVLEGRRIARDALHVGVPGHGPVPPTPGRMLVIRDRIVVPQLTERVVREAVREGLRAVQHDADFTHERNGVQTWPVTTDDEFRSEARAWLEEHAPAMRARLDAASTDREHFDASRAWQQELFDGGWAGIAWPAEFGGRGATSAQATIFGQEQSRFSVSAGFVASTIGMVGPVLLRYGTDEQKARYLSRSCARTRSGASCSASRLPGAIWPTSPPAPNGTGTSSS